VVYSLTERGAALNAAAGSLCLWSEHFGLMDDAQIAKGVHLDDR
jgi:hypothetical protein